MAPLLPVKPAKPKRHVSRIDNRTALTAKLVVLQTGLPQKVLSQEMALSSGLMYHGWLRDWQAAGTWDQMHRELLRRLHQTGRLYWSQAYLHSSPIAARAGEET